MIASARPTPAHDEARRRLLFEQLVRDRCRFVLYFFLARDVPYRVAEELAQETLMRVWRGIDRLSDPDAKEGWLVRIAENVYKNHRRSLSRFKRGAREVALDGGSQAAQDLADPAPDVLTNAVEAERTRLFRAALDLLPMQMRRTVLLYLDGRSYREIARLLRKSEDTVRSQLSQARRRLRAALREEGQR